MENTLTLPRIVAYRKFWSHHPPVDRLAAAYIGYKPKNEKPTNIHDLAGIPGLTIKSDNG